MAWCAGFSRAFWAAYDTAIPRAPGWQARRDLYSLYHVLNHGNLFGGSGYWGEAEALLKRLRAAVGA
jgi:protein-ribulosamine 3-kinase